MAYNEKEIIKKIEAETRNEKLIPTVLSSKRSAFLNKRGSFEKTPGVEIQLKTGSAPNIQHWFRVCAHLNHTNGLWEQIPYFSTDPEYFIYFYWTGNPLNSTYTSSQSEAFYQYIIANIVDSQTGNVGVSSLNVGDEIMFDLSDAWPNGACILSGYGKQDAMCLEYMGFVDNPQLSTQNSVSALSLLSPSTSIPIPFTFSSKTECCNYPNLISCYNIGDIGPEGGIIFSVPGVGSNTSTDTYYEVAQDDIAIGGTPQAGFNVSCGDPPSSQSVQFTITGVSLTFQATYSINVGDTITSTTPGLVPPGTTITIVNYFGALTSIQLSNSLTQTSGQHTFTITTGVSSPWSASGAEWGVHNKPNIITSLDFGTGQKNTDEIDAYPLSPGTPTGGIHPWLDSHDIAATLCKQTEGWFLPSYWEFREMMDQPSVVSQLGLNTSTQNSENYYWTSSHRLPLGTTLPNPDKYAWAYNTDTDNLELATDAMRYLFVQLEDLNVNQNR